MQEPMIKEAFRAESIFTQDEIKRRAYELKKKRNRIIAGIFSIIERKVIIRV